jgi:outer membrane protein assembly factor BamB
VTIGVEGILSCHDASSGKQLWRHDEFKGNVPRFATSSSPIVTDGLCIAQLGGSDGGGILACDLETGKEKWKWTGDGAAYGSPVLTAIGDTKVIVAPTNDHMVALDVAKGSLLWQIEYSQGRYNAATPMVDEGTLIFAGPESGLTAEQLALKDAKLEAKDLWRNTDNSVQFNTPVLKDGLLYGLSTSNDVFCIDRKTGETLWSKPLDESAAAGASQDSGRSRGGRGRSRGGRRGGGGGGYGSIVDAGSVLFALTPAGKLTVFKPGRKGLERVADYTVAGGGTYAYPVIAGNRIFIKDEDSVTSWSIQ